MRTWQETLQWYDSHNTTSQIGFNPDHMCLAVCRTAREAPFGAASAKISQDNTPKEFRVYKVRDLRKGMVLYFDDPHDSNPFGHIVTMIGRVKGYNPDDLNDVLVETNSVVSGRVVVVRASYFKQHWGDSYQFGAFWLNGAELDYLGWKHDGKGKDVERPKPDHAPRIDNFRDSRPNWDVKILDRAVENGGRADLPPKIKAIEAAVKGLPNDDDDKSRVSKFKDQFKKDRTLNMQLLNDAIAEGRTGDVKAGRDKINAAIKSVLRH
jgi:hypothetical protein